MRIGNGMTYAQVHRQWRRIVAVAAIGLTTLGAAAVTNGADAARSHNPFGAVTALTQVNAGLRVTGWTADPDTTKSLRYAIDVDGKRATKVLHVAKIKRSDVARKTGLGSRHGLVLTFNRWANGKKLTNGVHSVCIRAVDVGKGKNTTVACKKITLHFAPTGKITSVKQVPNGVQVAGWSYDRSNPTTKINVVATVAGRSVTVQAGRAQAGMPKAAGKYHGFLVTVPVAKDGTYSVCVTGKNVGPGSNYRLPCVSAKLDYSPVGAITSLSQSPNGFKITAWATDPDRTSAGLSVSVLLDNKIVLSGPGNRSGSPKSGHMFTGTYANAALPGGTHQVCLRALNVKGTSGVDRSVACKSIALNFNPTAHITSLTQVPGTTSIRVHGYADDPDTSAAVNVAMTLAGVGAAPNPQPAKGPGSAAHDGHVFDYTWSAVTSDSSQTVVVTPQNVGGTAKGPKNPTPATQTITPDYSPTGAIEGITDATQRPIVVNGWAVDRNDSTALVTVTPTVDDVAQTPVSANTSHSAVTGYGTNHGFSITLPTDDEEHQVCLTANGDNIGRRTTLLGCKTVYAVKPTVPAKPVITVVPQYAGATVNWPAPTKATDGGGQMLSYTVTAAKAGSASKTATVAASATSYTFTGLTAGATYSFTLKATNTAGSTLSAAVSAKTQTAPPPQTTPAPVSTSRYVRNIHDSNASDIATMKAEGVADAKANPSGHRYLVLLQIGGQDQYDGGVVLSAGVRFVTYATVVANVKSYLDGYASAQKASAPVTIAVGTNNDMDVNATTGKQWADLVVDPIVAYAKKYSGMTIAGANDIEPGFRATYAQSATWLSGYLGATSAPFVFNGSADGCSWTATGKGCNNGWTMAGLYNLAAGASPTRITNLPQIYNTTMPKQWKYISLTGVVAGKPRINFGGPLTEWTACDQAGSCGSITGKTAWSQLWSQLQSDSRLKVGSVPYSTDLRIDK